LLSKQENWGSPLRTCKDGFTHSNLSYHTAVSNVQDLFNHLLAMSSLTKQHKMATVGGLPRLPPLSNSLLPHTLFRTQLKSCGQKVRRERLTKGVTCLLRTGGAPGVARIEQQSPSVASSGREARIVGGEYSKLPRGDGGRTATQ